MKLKVTIVGLLAGVIAWGAEPVICAIGVGTTTANGTHIDCPYTTLLPDGGPVSDGGITHVQCTPDAGSLSGLCVWQKGSTIMMQCNTDVYFDSTDGGTATSYDQRVDFSSNSDPYLIYLDNKDQNISVLGVSAAGTCKFSTTKRPKPWQ